MLAYPRAVAVQSGGDSQAAASSTTPLGLGTWAAIIIEDTSGHGGHQNAEATPVTGMVWRLRVAVWAYGLFGSPDEVQQGPPLSPVLHVPFLRRPAVRLQRGVQPGRAAAAQAGQDLAPAVRARVHEVVRRRAEEAAGRPLVPLAGRDRAPVPLAEPREDGVGVDGAPDVGDVAGPAQDGGGQMRRGRLLAGCWVCSVSRFHGFTSASEEGYEGAHSCRITRYWPL